MFTARQKRCIALLRKAARKEKVIVGRIGNSGSKGKNSGENSEKDLEKDSEEEDLEEEEEENLDKDKSLAKR